MLPLVVVTYTVSDVLPLALIDVDLERLDEVEDDFGADVDLLVRLVLGHHDVLRLRLRQRRIERLRRQSRRDTRGCERFLDVVGAQRRRKRCDGARREYKEKRGVVG